MTVVVRAGYGWSGDGKSAAEIAGDIEHTRYRLDADLRVLRRKVTAAKRVVPAAALGLATLAFLLRRVFRRR